ncbi:hypothetical protein JCM19241_5340 [Vibrio ishigakensis]|uniref:Outer membrane protein beta-barrel domain-containing protein n=1 Tax=Vibrio ishigakensis TaxID=1481914 RepID=A0A0B8QHR1_9VIBR|nr:hypothetical protein JCM19241_5340 [Vibrio ishigakensis]
MFAEEKKEKHHEDPTKIVTKLGIGYNGDATFSGSIGLDEARMLNGRVNHDGSEWSVGGSWLFDIGILNFYFGRNTYDDDSHNTSYSVGTFVPLSYFALRRAVGRYLRLAVIAITMVKCGMSLTLSLGDYVFRPQSSHGGYLGAFAFKPLTEHWSVMTFGGAGLGSDDYSNYWIGGGVSYKINDHHSLNTFAMYSDSSIYDSDSKLGVNYKYEFK